MTLTERDFEVGYVDEMDGFNPEHYKGRKRPDLVIKESEITIKEIIRNQEYVERVGEKHLDEIAENKVIKHRIEKLIKLLDEDHTSDMAECNDYIIGLLKGVLR